MPSVLNAVSADATAPQDIRFDSVDEVLDTEPPAIDPGHAISICHADALAHYSHLHHCRIEIYLEKDGWHVAYWIQQRNGSRVTGGCPHYVIDANTGEILDKKYYQ